jgi:diguanylate cyclase (GGDEF)-like protein
VRVTSPAVNQCGESADQRWVTSTVSPRSVVVDPEFVRSLLQPGGIVSVFQPLVRVSDGRVVGYEALSRARADPSRPPDQWLEEAEAQGLRVDVELACLSAAAAQGPPPEGALLFVNVGHSVLLDPRFDTVRESLPPHVLELTEHEPVADYAELCSRLQPWLETGTLLAIDDVGAGYASMAHVLRLSPAFVKIDRSLIAGIHHSRLQRSLVEALVAFAQGMHATTIAEGVEAGAELDVLRDCGVDIVQGYLLARPGPPWVRPADPARRKNHDVSADLAGLRALVERTTHPQDAADHVTRFLSRDGRLLPSVYIARSGVLRCLSRRGQWLVQDGMPPGIGITGACFDAQTELLVGDVRHDPRYRPALPGVVSELAVPIRVRDEVIGVLNVDVVTPLTATDASTVREAAAILSERMAVIGHVDRRHSALHELGRRAPRVATGPTPAQVAARTVEATLAITGLESAAVWVGDPLGVQCLAHTGPAAGGLTSLTRTEVAALGHLAADFTSCYSGGGALDLGFGPTQILRERGAFAMLLAPLRDGERRIGLLCAVSRTAANVESDTVEAVELLCLHAGSRLAALDRLHELQEMVYRDALTRVANRMRWDELLDDRRGASGPIGWLAAVDVDRFKSINDSHGHVAGDRVLQAVATELAAPPLNWENVFRTGGDEFALLFPCIPQHEAATLAATIRHRAAQTLEPFGANVSIGISRIQAGQHGLRDSFVNADAALYLVKQQGGAAFRFH